jgi:hypothetical protein
MLTAMSTGKNTMILLVFINGEELAMSFAVSLILVRFLFDKKKKEKMYLLTGFFFFFSCVDSEWKNQKRQRQICDKYIQSSKPVFPVTNKFSVLISTYNPDRIEHLSLIIRHLLKSKKVHTVFVTWHNPELDVPENLIKDRRVKVLRQSFDSLNNRFNPVKDLETDAVYIMDDDIYIDLTDLEFTFDVSGNHFDFFFFSKNISNHALGMEIT